MLHTQGKQLIYVVAKPEACPGCGHSPIADIFYGRPAMSEELRHQIEAGKIVLGGCVPEEATWFCSACGLTMTTIKSTKGLPHRLSPQSQNEYLT